MRVWLLCECVYPCHVTTTVVTAGQLTLFVCVHVEMNSCYFVHTDLMCSVCILIYLHTNCANEVQV